MALTESTEPDEVVVWAIRTLNADAELCAAIAGGQVWQTLPRAADTKALPGVAVGWQSAAQPTGAIQTGPFTYTEQTVILRVQVSQQTVSRLQLKAVKGRVIRQLAGQFGQVLPNGGELIECVYLQPLPDVIEPFGDTQVITGTLWFRTSSKVLQ